MKKWYQKPYFNKEIWLLENFDKLSLNNDEILLLLLINYCNSNDIIVSYEFLSKKLNKTNRSLDKIISNLVTRHYLSISTNEKGLYFDIDNIFEFDVETFDIKLNDDLYNVIETVFSRPLSTNELQKSHDLIEKYGENKFMDALRIAEAKRNIKMAYIEGILKNNEKK